LLIEDDEGNALTTSALLEDVGYVVDVARTIAEAQCRLPGSAYALVLLDNRLADGNGLDLIPELRRHLPCVHIVLVSGEMPSRRAVGVDAVFIKGTDFALLLAILGRLCEGGAAHGRQTPNSQAGQ
jgi:two-component system OmpR family response regulator